MLKDAEELLDGNDMQNYKSYQNRCSLRVSAELSFNLLEDHNPKCIQVLFLLGCLPGGATLK